MLNYSIFNFFCFDKNPCLRSFYIPKNLMYNFQPVKGPYNLKLGSCHRLSIDNFISVYFHLVHNSPMCIWGYGGSNFPIQTQLSLYKNQISRSLLCAKEENHSQNFHWAFFGVFCQNWASVTHICLTVTNSNT